MENRKELTASIKWDHGQLRAETPETRGLLIDVSAPSDDSAVLTSMPLNLALVIDASGSMGHGRLEAAKTAAIGICEALGPEDRLSVVSFASEMMIHVDAVSQDDTGRRVAISEIGKLRTRGCTDLSGGWFEGGACVARAMEKFGCLAGHVVVLSDGKANRGLTRPRDLAEHSAALAARGITTSAVGIGDGYSPLQLDALAEAGGGRLHDAASPDEIIEVVLGELREALSVAARNVEVIISSLNGATITALSHYKEQRVGDQRVFSLGSIAVNARRSLALLVEVPPLPADGMVTVAVSLRWTDPETGTTRRQQMTETRLLAVPGYLFDSERRDKEVAERISLLWEASLGYKAMRRNESRDYLGAETLYADNDELLRRFSVGLGIEQKLSSRVHVARKRMAKEWQGRTKRDAMVLAKKSIKSEPDFRSADKGDWFDHLSE